jgi:glycosyltransferase involved in cell wall biosynthesis
MRICLVSIAAYPHGIGGMQDHLCDLARGLVVAGHEVEVVAGQHPDLLRREERDGAVWHFVSAPGHHMDPRWMRESTEAVLALHRERPFDVVHGQGSSALELVRRGMHREVAIVTMFHGNFVGLARAAFRRAAAKPTPVGVAREARGLLSLSGEHFPHGNWYRFRECEAIVPSRQQVRDTCRSHRLDPGRVHVVPNGIDAGLFRPPPEGRKDGGEVVFACVGRLNHEKGMHHAIRAIAEIEDARLVVVGDGEKREQLETLARELRIEDRVVFTGRQPREGVAERLAEADVFLFPTEREEAAPLVLPQAMACGLPAVASRIGGITEVIDRPGENGLLLPPGDLGALVEAARTLARDGELRRRMGAAARSRVLEDYTIERMTERTVAVYELAQSRLPRPEEADANGELLAREASRA